MRDFVIKWANILNQAVFSLLCFCLIYFCFGNYFGIAEYSGRHIVWGAMFLAILVGWITRTAAEKVWSFWIGIAAIILFHFFAGFGKMLEFWKDYGNWLFGIGEYEPERVAIFCILQLIPIAVAAYLAWYLVTQFQYVRIAAAVFIAGALFWCWFDNILLDKKSTAILFGAFYYLCIYMVQDKWKKTISQARTNGAKAGYMAFLSPFVLLMFLALCVSPESDTPLEWHFIREIVRTVEHKMTSWRINGVGRLAEEFSMEMNGLSEKNTLAGSALTNPKVLLTFDTDANAKTNVYMTGMVYRDFDGRDWGENVRSDADTVIDSLLTMTAVSDTAEFTTDYIEMGNAHISYLDFHSNEEFLPAKTWRYTDPDETFGADKFLGYGSEYDVGFLQLNLDNLVWYQLMTDGHTVTEEAWNDTNRRQFREKKVYSYDELTEYVDRIKRTYSTKIPVSKEIEEWLEKATLSEQELSPVDRLYRIESALSQMIYTKTPGEMPEEVQSPTAFLDYFVLKKQEGYCTYFATAFVLLARNEGFPARLCTGFCIPTKGKKNTEVTSGMAHAWPEVFIDGIGWIPFEPTPGFGQLRYTPWAIRKTAATTQQNLEEYYKHLAEKEELKRLEEEAAQAAERNEVTAHIDYRDITAVVVRAVLAIIAFLLFCVFVYILQKVVQLNQFGRMNKKEQFEWLYRRNTDLLRMLHIRRAETETLQEFAARLEAENLPGALSQRSMERVAYAGITAETDDLKLLLADSEAILACVREKHSKRIRIFVQSLMNKGFIKRIERA